MKKCIFLLVMLFISMTNVQAKMAIVGEDLYSAPDIWNMSLSPNGHFIASHHNEEDNYVLKITHIDSNKSHRLEFLKDADGYLNSFVWINNNALSINYNLDEKKGRKGFVTFDFDGKKFDMKFKIQQAEGDIIGFPRENDNISF